MSDYSYANVADLDEEPYDYDLEETFPIDREVGDDR